eukprot:scaffold2.g7208.t1
MSPEGDQTVGCCGFCRRKQASTRSAKPCRESAAASSPRKASASVAVQPETATLKPHLTGRRSRSDSPLPDGERGTEAPLKRQNSMGDDAVLKSRSSPTAAVPPPVPAPALPPLAQDSGASTSTQQHEGSAATEQPSISGSGSGRPEPPPAESLRSPAVAAPPPAEPPGEAAVLLHGCPPYGTKSVIGRRPKMEDACVAVPYLAEVPVLEAALDELLPPRIAPQLRSSGAGPGSPTVGAGAASMDARSSYTRQPSYVRSNSGRGESGDAVETLHFFGVFDGHGGADAALHCARTLHERVRQVLSACVASGGGGPAASVAEGPADSSQQQQQQQPQQQGDEGPAVSSSGDPTTAGSAAPIPIPAPRDPSPSTDYQDASQGVQDSASSGNSSSFLECEVDDSGGRVEGVACTSEAIEAALTKAFHITDEEFGNMGGYEHLALVGTTAVVALLGTRMIYVANCGDSRAVLSRNGAAVPLTDDHKAAREDETARVEAAGGQILFWNGVRVMGLLAVSRAIGDHSLRPYVIAEPEVTVISRHTGDELLVMASDGLWDVMTNQEACTLAKKCLQRARQRGSSRQSAARVAATVLTRAAVDRGSRDNVTVVIVDLSPATEAELAAEAAERRRSEPAPAPPSPFSAPPSAFAVEAESAPFAPPAVAGPALRPGIANPVGGGGGAPKTYPAALVSPFASGALPEGLDFDVEGHANKVAAAAAALAEQQQRRASGGDGDGAVPMQTGK